MATGENTLSASSFRLRSTTESMAQEKVSGRAVIASASKLAESMQISPLIINARVLTVFIALGCIPHFPRVYNNLLAPMSNTPRLSAKSDARDALQKVVTWTTPARWAPVAKVVFDTSIPAAPARDTPEFMRSFFTTCNEALPPGEARYTLPECAALYAALLMPTERHRLTMKRAAEYEGSEITPEAVAEANYPAVMHRVLGRTMVYLTVRSALRNTCRKGAQLHNAEAFLSWVCAYFARSIDAVWTAAGTLRPEQQYLE